MPPAGPLHLHLAVAAVLLLSTLLHAASAATPTEVSALISFKQSLTIPPAADAFFASWDATAATPCKFTGVTCRGSAVVSLSVDDQNVSAASVPFDVLCGGLKSLATLSLRCNALAGPIAGVDACVGLVELTLAFNNFSGEVPDLRPLAGLRTLNLSSNAFSGSFPWSALTAMPGLEVLSAGDIPDLTPTKSFPAEITRLTNLTALYLSAANIVGAIPAGIGRLTKLARLELADNRLSGEIPPAIAKLTNLQSLELYNCSLTGALPPGFGKLTKLSKVNLANNKLAGAIPVELHGLTRLNSLDVSSNELSGAVPEFLAELKLSYLNLSDNRLDGPVPPGLAISAYGESFQGNPGLCATNGAGILRSCTPRDGGHPGSFARMLITCLLAGMAVLLAVPSVVIFIKKRRRNAEAAAMARDKRSSMCMCMC